jgi:hypothetical protein
MASIVLRDSTLGYLTPSVNAPLLSCDLQTISMMRMLASYFTMGKAYGRGIFMKCGVILGYNLGPRALIS